MKPDSNLIKIPFYNNGENFNTEMLCFLSSTRGQTCTISIQGSKCCSSDITLMWPYVSKLIFSQRNFSICCQEPMSTPELLPCHLVKNSNIFTFVNIICALLIISERTNTNLIHASLWWPWHDLQLQISSQQNFVMFVRIVIVPCLFIEFVLLSSNQGNGLLYFC